MSQGTYEFTGGDAFELMRLDRALSELSRPATREEWLAPLTRADLCGLGLFSGSRPPLRKELIERLWSRKRQLMRRTSAFDDWDTEPPVA